MSRSAGEPNMLIPGDGRKTSSYGGYITALRVLSNTFHWGRYVRSQPNYPVLDRVCSIRSPCYLPLQLHDRSPILPTHGPRLLVAAGTPLRLNMEWVLVDLRGFALAHSPASSRWQYNAIPEGLHVCGDQRCWYTMGRVWRRLIFGPRKGLEQPATLSFAGI